MNKESICLSIFYPASFIVRSFFAYVNFGFQRFHWRVVVLSAVCRSVRRHVADVLWDLLAVVSIVLALLLVVHFFQLPKFTVSPASEIVTSEVPDLPEIKTAHYDDDQSGFLPLSERVTVCLETELYYPY